MPLSYKLNWEGILHCVLFLLTFSIRTGSTITYKNISVKKKVYQIMNKAAMTAPSNIAQIQIMCTYLTWLTFGELLFLTFFPFMCTNAVQLNDYKMQTLGHFVTCPHFSSHLVPLHFI